MPLIYGWIPKPGASTRGCGKTGGMVWHLHQRKQEGKKILTNMETVSFQDDVITANKLKMLPEDLIRCCIGFSEIHLFLESRRTQKTDQIMVTYAISQFRKRRIEAHWDSQDVGKVDIRLQQETDILIHCENLGCGDIDCRDRSCGIPTCGIFHYEMYDKRSTRFIDEFWLNGPKDFYHLFDSEEVVMDFLTDEPENE